MIQIVLIFLLAFFVRTIKIQDYLFFGFEQGRDLQVIQKIYQLKDFVLVGPSTSIGGLFHGVWYYYLLSVPLGITSGNPLSASFVLIILGSLMPLVIYFLAWDIFRSRLWGGLAAFVAIFSYEYTLYSRWLSNVSPAPLFIALAFLMLWKYCQKNSGKYFFWFVVFSGLAVLFQMMLLAQFVMVFILLLALKQFKLPSLKIWGFSFFAIIVLFGPLIIFNIRNQYISFYSLVSFAGNSGAGESGNLANSFSAYFSQMKSHFQSSLINLDIILAQTLAFFLIILGIILGFKENKKRLIFVLCWILMSLPVIFISPGNPQYYVGVGIGWILLFTFVIQFFWRSNRFKFISVILMGLFLAGIFTTLNNLFLNKDVFFRTIQDDLNYADQRRVLEFVHNDSAGRPYRFISFTIPSLQPEGWDYLKHYFYPGDQQGDAKIIYIVIEKNVYPVWENKWINDLGKTDLVFEKKIGLLRVQKRLPSSQ